MHGSDDSVAKWGMGFEQAQVGKEMIDDAVEFVDVAAAGVRGDEAVGGFPQGMVGREWFGDRDIQKCACESARIERVEQGVLIDGGTSADVVENGAGFHGGETRGVQKSIGGGAGREDVDDVIRLGEEGFNR